MNVGRFVRGGAWAISMGTSFAAAAEHNAFISIPSSSPSPPLRKSRSSSARRSLASRFTDTRSQPQLLCSCKEASPACEKPSNLKSPSPVNVWRSLGVDQSELSLALSLPTGQSFRWKLTANSEYTGVIDNYLFTLRQAPNVVEYMLHNICTLDSCCGVDPCHDTRSSHTCSVHANGANAKNTCSKCHHLCVRTDNQDSPILTVNGDQAKIVTECSKTTALQHTLACHPTRDPDVNVNVAETADAYLKTHDPQAHLVNADGGETTKECCNSYTRHHSHASQTLDPRICPVCIDQAETSLKNYLNLDTSLKDVWAPFVAADARFAALAPHMAGARLLRQRPLECLFQFICSSNNHIQRISQMVDYLASLGPYLGTVGGFSFHAFPSLDTLAKVTEAELRKAGFGYRAKYIVGAVKELQSKKGGGEEWLYSLRARTLKDAIEELCSLPGIGPKVAACIALFSLDQHHAIPVDTHVWQIATTYITPELSGERLTAKLHTAVSEAFVKRFGEYAGWAQNVLFIAELSSHQLYLPEHLRTSREKKLKGKSRKKAKI